MKPVQVGILVAVAAVGGALFMKWQIGRNAAPIPAAVSTAPAPAPPAAQPAPEQTPASLPSPFVEEKQQPKQSPAPHRHPKAKPQMIAQTPPPAVSQPPEPQPAPQPAPPAPAAAVKAEPEEPAPAPPLPPPPPPRQVTLTAGMMIPVRTVEGLSSDRNQTGDTFTATLDQPLVVDGLVIAERGAHLEGKVVQAQRAGRVKGLSNLAIELTQLWTSDGQRVTIQTETFEKHGESSKGEDAAKVGAGAAIGAAIGAIAGGGKGAGIGAAAGGAAGAGDVLVTRGKPAVLPAETRINFRLRNTITLTERHS